MLVLGVDTSGAQGSIALVTCENNEQQTVAVVPVEGGTFSAQLIPQIAALLSTHNFVKDDIGGFAVVSGPGSFTGLRVGLAAIKALAEVLHKPIAAISLLEAVAIAGAVEGQVLAALDAGRNEVYCGEYQVVGGNARLISQQVVPGPELKAAAHGLVIVTPDGTVVNSAKMHNLPAKEVNRPRADVIARLGVEKIQQGNVITPEVLDAAYIRRSDAEVKLGR